MDAIFVKDETLTRLGDSLATIESFALLAPPAFTHENPAWYAADAWSVAMNIAHMVVYEECIGGPLIEALAAGSDGVGAIRSDLEQIFLPDAQKLSSAPIASLLERLRTVRDREIAAVAAIDAVRFNAPITPLFSGPQHGGTMHSPAFVATKTFQHTWEHGNAIPRLALFAPRA